MLKLVDITKTYASANVKVDALKGVSLDFARGEFVAVLGPSGCGKTTLLNIVGGLDRYTSGDLIINGRSTKNYSQKDMDAYRNHSVGFVFQSYNLIPHQSVLANVELALTLSGISKGERRNRAKAALESVGLGDQLHKRPNQLSGGQMQRVAIARAMVNDPDVLLADEPTGALDSTTSLQVLDVLKELAKDRLVIMVTHNRDLAERYATRIIQLKDGLVETDSRPLLQEAPREAAPQGKKTAMGFGTALSLSLNNLMTKRGRTLITAFAGSIGIIGIALILALSNGVNQYIINVQKDTMSSYPITIQEETFQVEGMMTSMREAHRDEPSHGLDAVYMNTESIKAASEFQSSVTKNNLTAFKAFLEEPGNPVREVISDISYGYQANFDVFAFDKDGELLNLSSPMGSGRFDRGMAAMLPFSLSAVNELLPASEDGLAGKEIKEKYTLLAGDWPQTAFDVVLILDSDNEIADVLLYQMGLITAPELQSLMAGGLKEGQEAPFWKYGDLLGHAFYLMPGGDMYEENSEGIFTDLRDNRAALKAKVQNAQELKVSGIVRLDDQNAFTRGGLGYTKALTDHVVASANESPVLKAQAASADKSVITGLLFSPETQGEKAGDLRKFVSSLSDEDKRSFAQQALMAFPQLFSQPGQEPAGEEGAPGEDGSHAQEGFSFPFGTMGNSMFGSEGMMDFLSMMEGRGTANGDAPGMELDLVMQLFDTALLMADDKALAALYDTLVAPEIPSLEETFRLLGKVNLDTPHSIALYVDTFEDKEEVTRLIAEYNEGAEPGNAIAYTDYVALMISGVTTIINVISYVLIAFVAVSLVVSSIMIGIITYISVLERTKEIGILRAVGASKKDVGRVFTAEAFIIGLFAGILGIALSALMMLPINAIIARLTDDASVKAILPLEGAAILIAISAMLSLLAGWIPSRIAAKKDPVEALRTE